MNDKCDVFIVDIANDSAVISTTPIFLYGWYVNTALSAHACPVMDGVLAKFTLPASLAAGSFVMFPNPVRFNALTIDPNDAATGNVSFLYNKM